MMMKIKRRAAYTLIEITTVLLILSIVGLAAISMLWMAFNMFSQTDDFIAERQEIEYMYQMVAREFTNIGLGMPNNAQGKGTFAGSFNGGGANSPIMAYMGKAEAEWGGPITIGKANSRSNFKDESLKVKVASLVNGRNIYHGSDLYYAWGIPTGVRVGMDRPDSRVATDISLVLPVLPYTSGQPLSGLHRLRDITYGGKNVGITVAGDNALHPIKAPNSWILFPSLKIPMYINSFDSSSSPPKMRVTVAENSSISLKGVAVGLEEVHLLQVAHIYLDTSKREVVQIIFGSNFENASTNTRRVLARNISGLYFSFDPDARLLTAYIAARGTDSNQAGWDYSKQPFGWPTFAPPINSDDLYYRTLVNVMTWRIRN